MDGKLFTYDDEQVNEEVPVTCLGITFENDTKRREYFREELRKKLRTYGADGLIETAWGVGYQFHIEGDR